MQKDKSGKNLIGTVVSTSMKDVVVIDIERKKFHRLYSKGYTVNKRIKAKNEIDDVSVGDRVLIAETKPVSKNVAFKVVSVEK